MNTLPNIVSFSGGLSSGDMLRRLIEANPDFNERFIVVFENTGKEHNATLEFVRDFQAHYKIKIVWLVGPAQHAPEVHVLPGGRQERRRLDAVR